MKETVFTDQNETPALGKLFIKKLTPTAQITKNSVYDAGYDIHSDEDIILEPNTITLVSTGLSGFASSVQTINDEESGKVFEVIHNDCWIKLFSRSGLCVKSKITVDAGVIDANYRGPWKVALRNETDIPYKVSKGDRICQGVIMETIHMPIEEVTTLPDSDRGNKGFGSSGK